MKITKISALPPATTLTGLYTLGTDSNAQSVKVSLEFVQTAANTANTAAGTANTAAAAATAAKQGCETATAAATAAKQGCETATAAATAAKQGCETATAAANTAAQRAEEAAEQIEFASKIYTAVCPAIARGADGSAVWELDSPIKPRTVLVAQMWRTSDNSQVDVDFSVSAAKITARWNTESNVAAGAFRIVIIG